ncbi:9596_t:CDS:1, partial [Gigaspora margarita]
LSEALFVPTSIFQTNDMTNLFLITNSIPTIVHLSIFAKEAMKKKKAYAKTIGI